MWGKTILPKCEKLFTWACYHNITILQQRLILSARHAERTECPKGNASWYKWYSDQVIVRVSSIKA